MTRRKLLVSVLVLAALLYLAGSAAAAGLSRPVLDKIRAAVVYIDVKLTGGNLDGDYESTGSGFVISPDGQIVTNAHVVSYEVEGEERSTMRAAERVVTVTFYAGTDHEQTLPATVVREHAPVDLALLKVDRQNLQYLDLGDSDAALETTPIFVCGHPLGLRELSVRTGTVTAHRTWEGRKYVEHDAAAEVGNSGGPVVDSDGVVLGVHTLTLSQANAPQGSRFAIPSSVVSAWLQTRPDQDAAQTTAATGSTVADLLQAANLSSEDAGDGIFLLPYENDVKVFIHQYKEFVRVFGPLGELPGADDAERGAAAVQTLGYNWRDPIGRFSLNESDDGRLLLFWECQVPQSAATADLVRFMTDTGAGSVAGYPKGEIPGHQGAEGDSNAIRDLLDQAKLNYEWNDRTESFDLPYNVDEEEGADVTIHVKALGDMVWTFCWVGGLPGDGEREHGAAAIKILKRNWDDPLGRLSRDDDNDICWESQVLVSAMTPDYLAIIGGTCAEQVAAYWQEFGVVPLNGG